jgi:diguanylate cyclase (GGDEF)-like protein
MADVDRFKRFNDEHGHQAGDAVLRSVGATLKANARPTDMVARYGGEEFAVLLPATPLDDALVACERLREAIGATPVRGLDGAALPGVTASFGVAQLLPGEAMETLVERADQALYRAKEGGRNRVCA